MSAAGAGWQEHKDDTSGQVYYFNPSTGHTTWTTPPELQQAAATETKNDEWWELFDANRGRPYFYNPATQQTVWEPPPGVVPLVIVPEGGAAGGGAGGAEKWTEVIDPKTGRAYYVNGTTGQSSWVKPADANTSTQTPPAELPQPTLPEDPVAVPPRPRIASDAESPVAVPPRPRVVSMRAPVSSAISPSNRHTMALGKGSPLGGGGGAGASGHLPVFRTQDDIHTSPRSGRRGTLPHPAPSMLPPSPASSAGYGASSSSPMRGGSMIVPPSGSAPLVVPLSQRSSSMIMMERGAPSLGTTNPPSIVSPRSGSGSGSHSSDSMLSVPEVSFGGGAASLSSSSSGDADGKKEKKEKKGGSERKKKLAFRKTAIFGKEHKESKHKKTHSISGVQRAADSAAAGTGTHAQLSNSGNQIPARGEDLDSDGSDIMPTLPKSIIVDINKFQLEGYARKFFNAQKKKGVFTRKKTPVKELLMFQKHPLEVSLLNFHKPELQKKALDIFKLILAYQGVGKRETNESPLAIARQLAAEGITEGQIRDELFCQLCKQTCYTPNEEYLYKGWELMVVSCLTFPPTQDLEAWFRKYLEEHIRPAKGTDKLGKEAIYARFCLKKLNLMCQKQGPSRGRVPSLREIEKIIAAPFHFSPFGADLDEIMAYERTRNPSAQVPRVVEFLCDSVLRLNGCQIEGLFRIPGDSEGIYTSKADIECGNFDISNFRDANVPAALLKLWLRELAHPLIPDALYEKALKSGHDPKRVLEVVEKSPRNNQNVIYHVIRFIQHLALPENQAKTKMNVNNLAMIFAPTFLRCPTDNPHDLMENARFEQDFVHDLIVNLS